MKCPRCGSERSLVIDSRSDGTSTRRRRECPECQYRFSTYERIERSLPLVVKKDARRESFHREKLKNGVLRACEKRPVSVEAIEDLLDKVEIALHESCEKEIDSVSIGDVVMSELRKIDDIAYVRFASVYREFSDVSQFVDNLETLDEGEEQTTKKVVGI